MSENFFENPNSTEGIFPPDGYIFDQYTEVQRTFIDKVRASGISEGLKYLRTVEGNDDLTSPARLCVRPEENGSQHTFEISEHEDFSDSFTLSGYEEFEIENLKNGVSYFWRIDGGRTHLLYTLDNEWRFINIDGLHNLRDLGGRKIKVGILYRGCELSGCDFNVTERGKKTLLGQLKIKSELDLRKEYFSKYENGEAVEGVALKQIPYRPYCEIFEEEHREEIRKIMNFLSDESVYPVYFHCMGGADRTGMIALFLEALAGEEEEDIFLDYELTSLSRIYNPQKGVSDTLHRSRNAPYFTEFLKELEKYAKGKGLSEQVKAFLLDSGVSEECINKIVEIIKK